MSSPRIQFRAIGSLADNLSERAERLENNTSAEEEILLSEVARRDLERYYSILKRSTPLFSENEAMLLADALNGTLFDVQTAHFLWASISDALCDGTLAKKWKVDGNALVQRIQSLSYAEILACIDSIERVWNTTGYRYERLEDRLHSVGIIEEHAEDQSDVG